MRVRVPALIVLSLALATVAQNPPQNPQQPAEQPAQAQLPGKVNPTLVVDERPLTSLPYTPSLDVSAMDKSVDPCTDFYQYSCGGWEKKNPIPPDQVSWSVYGKVYDENQRFLWGILDDLAKKTTGRNATQQKIGDYFAACMEEAAVDKLGATPLKPRLEEIAALRSKSQIAALLGREHLATAGNGLLFGFGSNQDFANSEQVIAFATAGGLGLPDRDYYVKTDAKSQELRTKYVAHVRKMLELLGGPAPKARQHADAIMRLETALAKASLTRVERRDPYKLHHKMTRAQVQALTPAFDWTAYLKNAGLAAVNDFNVTEPEFYRELNRQLVQAPLDDIKAYLTWHVLHANAPYLSSNFVNEDFQFYAHTLRGAEQIRPRWKRCVSLVDRDLGEALGQEFVSRTFSSEMKQRTREMTRQIEQAMEQRINELDWMAPETKKQALTKLYTIVNKVGYPEKWRDYSAVEIRRGDFLGNVARAITFESKRQLAKIGKPLDRTEWQMTPPTVNAYYDPQMNDINFPAGVLQPPLYDVKLDDAPNYGNTGSTIGHELTHGFDDEGRKFDAKGNLRDWWTEKDSKEFERRTDCIANQYAQYTIVDDIKINSRLTLGEDVADLGGTILAYLAWKQATANQQLENREGLTPDQRFFIGFAQWVCNNERPENLRVRALTDPHSPGRYRINGVVVNMPEFEKAFSCKAGQPLVKQDRCRVW